MVYKFNIMVANKIFQYYLSKGDKKSAMRVKKSFFIAELPHERAIRKKKRIELILDKLLRDKSIQLN